jgi:hypothetical protein
MGINISNVGGNVRLKNISQKANVVLLSALTANMDIGTALPKLDKNDQSPLR